MTCSEQCSEEIRGATALQTRFLDVGHDSIWITFDDCIEHALTECLSVVRRIGTLGDPQCPRKRKVLLYWKM